MKKNVIQDKSFQFAVRVVRCCQHLQSKNEYVLSKQFLRSGTSIGANAREASQAASKKDFIYKMNIALKEAVETQYWIELLKETGYLKEEEANNLHTNCTELCKNIVHYQ
ncbi:MAG: four helix bundle protein [Tunicatimonas sp.]|uniref:four helix bundle protein n=1 Tax=Tunicatimonas sp. TaxID=1940096 RepID=UPI003C737DFC